MLERTATTFRKISSSLQIMDSPSSDGITQLSLRAFVLNIIVLYGFGVTAFVIPKFTGYFERGFFCNDESIRYPFRDNTVSSLNLFLVSIGMMLTTIMCGEYYVMRQMEREVKRPAYKWRNSHIHAYFVETLVYFGYSQVGFIMHLVLMQTTKYTIGRLRPHFMDVCKPVNYTCVTDMTYVTEYTCSGTNLGRIREAHLSFFSGHSSTAVYCAVFSILYLQSRLGGRILTRLLLPVVQTFLALVALVICYTRISDNWHHPTDVAAGIFVGTAIATYTTVVWGGFFSNSSRYGYISNARGEGGILADAIRGNALEYGRDRSPTTSQLTLATQPSSS